MAAQQRVRRALESAAGQELSGILIDVCCHLKGIEVAERDGGLPKRSGKILLRAALSLLVRHYGMENDGSAAGGSSRIRHWGDDGYRPIINGGQDT